MSNQCGRTASVRQKLCAAALAAVATCAAALPPAARASTGDVTWYMHGRGPVGNADEFLSNGFPQDPSVFMDEEAPTGPAPKVTTIATAPVRNDDRPISIHAAFWIGRARGTISDPTVTVWLQSRETEAGVRILLYADGQATPFATGDAVAPAGPAPTPVTVMFGRLRYPVTWNLRVRVLPTDGSALAVYYDSPQTPTQMRFGYARDVLPTGEGRIDADFGRVRYAGLGRCAARDEHCERALAMQRDSHVVVAVIDSGINPYHLAFRREGVDVHPSEYITGYPSDAEAILLSDRRPYGTARAADEDSVWRQVRPGSLYWFPGTNIIGAVSIFDDPSHSVRPDHLPILDDWGHGTAVTSVAAGRAFAGGATTPGTNPEALVVVVEGAIEESVAWARAQPWIDIISVSYGDPLGLPLAGNDTPGRSPRTGNEHLWTRPFVLDDGRTACFPAGNGLGGVVPHSSVTPMAGPSWVVTVGGVNPRSDQTYVWQSVPADVSADGRHAVADAFSVTGAQSQMGTSLSTPVACGVFSLVLEAGRRAIGDVTEGTHDGNPATGVPLAGSTALGDGVLTRQELQDAVLKTALPQAFPASTVTDPEADPFATVVPTTPAYFVHQGYGIVDAESAQRAIDVLLGLRPLPDRSDVDAWIASVDVARNVFYPAN